MTDDTNFGPGPGPGPQGGQPVDSQPGGSGSGGVHRCVPDSPLAGWVPPPARVAQFVRDGRVSLEPERPWVIRQDGPWPLWVGSGGVAVAAVVGDWVGRVGLMARDWWMVARMVGTEVREVVAEANALRRLLRQNRQRHGRG